MFTLFKKEIIQFLGSLTGYLAVVVFLLVSGLFLWVFPGSYNIPESGYASLEPFFQLAPWLYLFLVPAVTMRIFAEEKRSGTLELLLTRPLTDFRLVAAKFLAALVLVGFSLLPTLLYFFSVYRLGNPVGNIDTGSTWGAFTGLFLLAALYISIGLFASVVTDSQIVAFIFSMLCAFVFFLGFDFIADSGIPYTLAKTLSWFSINDHFLSLSRGVIDGRDLFFFVGMTAFFLVLTMVMLRRSRNSLVRAGKWMAGLAGALFLLFLISENSRFRIDLTADKRYSLSAIGKEVARSIDEPVTIELFLEGELPPGFRKLQQAIVAKAKDLDRYSGKPVRIKITDPYTAVPAAQRDPFFEELTAKGVLPTDLRRKTSKGTETTLIFPGALLTRGDQQTSVNFLKNNPGLNHEVNLNHSVESVEYELVSSLLRVMDDEKPLLVFLQGHGELNPYQVEDLATALSSSFRLEFADPSGLKGRNRIPGVLVIADPTEPFSESDKLVIDQLLMKGSRILWAVDPVEVSLDSLSQGFMTVAFPRDLNLNDQLFQYGIRLNSDLVQDVTCAQIMVNTSLSADKPVFTPQPWYYAPLLTPTADHPLTKNLNLLYSEFVSSVDTLSNPEARKATVILSSSSYGRVVRTPAGVSLESINRPPARELFNRPRIPAGVLLEGKFQSVFRNRIVTHLGVPAGELLEESPDTRIMVFSDGSLMANKVRMVPGEKPQILPLGYDRVSRQVFGNREFFIRAIQYLDDEKGVMQLLNNSLKLRLLDKVRLREQGTLWAWVNTALPVLFVLVFGLTFSRLRRRRYSADKS